MNPPRIRRSASEAFTLVEMLVALAIAGIMMLALVQMMNSTISTTLGSYKHMDADTQARLVLDRIGFDVARMTKRKDVDYYFQKNNPGNDQMAFYSESSGYYPASLSTSDGSDVSLAGYRINASHQLERLSKGLAWNGVSGLPSGASPMVYLPQTILGTWPSVTGVDNDYQLIGDQVFRLELCYLVQNSKLDATLSDTPYIAPLLSGTTANGMRDTLAIVATIGVLDAKSRLLVSDLQLAAAGEMLPHVSGTASPLNPNPIPNSPAILWQVKIASSSLGLPKAAASQVRIYQRYFYLNQAR